MSVIRKIEVKLIYPKIMKFLSQAFSSNTLLHGAYMAVLGAVGGACYPFVMAWANSQPLPAIKVILLTAAKAAGAALLAYLSKNGFLGGSGTATTPLTNKVTYKTE